LALIPHHPRHVTLRQRGLRVRISTSSI